MRVVTRLDGLARSTRDLLNTRRARGKSATVRRWCEQEAGVHQKHHRRAAADSDGRKSDPAQPIENQALFHELRQQEQTCCAKANCRDVLWREARAYPKPGHNDECGPDAHRRKAIEGAADRAALFPLLALS